MSFNTLKGGAVAYKGDWPNSFDVARALEEPLEEVAARTKVSFYDERLRFRPRRDREAFIQGHERSGSKAISDFFIAGEMKAGRHEVPTTLIPLGTASTSFGEGPCRRRAGGPLWNKEAGQQLLPFVRGALAFLTLSLCLYRKVPGEGRDLGGGYAAASPEIHGCYFGSCACVLVRTNRCSPVLTEG